MPRAQAQLNPRRPWEYLYWRNALNARGVELLGAKRSYSYRYYTTERDYPFVNAQSVYFRSHPCLDHARAFHGIDFVDIISHRNSHAAHDYAVSSGLEIVGSLGDILPVGHTHEEREDPCLMKVPSKS